jgi:dolichol-phosphate mannosyltransferase
MTTQQTLVSPLISPLDVSIVVPVRNEAGNVEPLLLELEAACAGLGRFEILYVNDGSSDETGAAIDRLRSTQRPWLRHLRHATSTGQSAAVRTGVRAAKGKVIVTLDGDGQNNPAFIPALVKALNEGGQTVGLAQGQRLGRQDTGFKKFQSRIANGVRGRMLKDGTHDSGCGLKCFPREVYLALPYFDALHRFMPALIRREGYGIVFVDVVDRVRHTGVSNYGFFDRLWVGLLDLCGVWWLIKRRKHVPLTTEV